MRIYWYSRRTVNTTCPIEVDAMSGKPTPGSKEAVDQGCTCPVEDNHHGEGSGYTDKEGYPVFWFDPGCPIHGESEHIPMDRVLYKARDNF